VISLETRPVLFALARTLAEAWPGTGTYDPDTNQTIWGTGNPVPMYDPTDGRATISTPTALSPGIPRPAR
jgi:hypothetical protein